MERRQLLGVLGGSLAIPLAGCLGGNGDNGDGDDGTGNGDDDGDDSNGTGDDPNGNGSDPGVPEASLSTLRIDELTNDIVIEAGAEHSFLVTVENVGTAAGSFDVTLTVGESISETVSTDELEVGASTDVQFEATTVGLPTGDHTATVETADDSTSLSFTVEAAVTQPEFALRNIDPQLVTVDVGETFSVSVDVENVGDQSDTQTVTLAVGDVSVQQEVTLSPGETESLTFADVSVDSLEEGEYGFRIATETAFIPGHLLLGEPGGGYEPPLTGAFEAESTGGFIGFGADTEAEARANGFDLPPHDGGGGPIAISGEIEAGSWESTEVTVPNLDAGGLEADLEAAGMDPGSVAVEVEVPAGFDGLIDQRGGRMVLSGVIEIVVTVDDVTETILVDPVAMAEESGALTGEMDSDDEPVTATLVDNQTEVSALGGEAGSLAATLDQVLGLPSPAGQTWFSIDLTLSNA